MSANNDSSSLTPMRRQYLRIKQGFPDTILLFRLGDFYETFDDDAKLVAERLDIVLTSRECGKGQRIPLAGIPYHALDSYLARLIRGGHKVAICEQVSDPSVSKGLVDRAVVRVVTPGTVVEPALLDENRNNYLVSAVVGDEMAGLAYADITTSEFVCAQFPLAHLSLEMERLRPAEILLEEGQPTFQDGIPVTRLEAEAWRESTARTRLQKHFNVSTLEAYGCEGFPLALRAAGALLYYLQETRGGALGQLVGLHTYHTERYMVMDQQTRRNLELFRAGRFDGTGPSLLSTVDMTHTSMGGRLLRHWLGQPLLELGEIKRRQDVVACLHTKSIVREELAKNLSGIADIERIVNRVQAGIANPREVVTLGRSLQIVPRIKELLQGGGETANWLNVWIHPCSERVELINQGLQKEPGVLGEGEVIRHGFSKELDQLREATRKAREEIAGLEERERARTGIASLKVAYNKVFGYYLVVTNPNLSKIPPEYVRRQTLVNAERFTTSELQEHESFILNAKESLWELEHHLFRELCLGICQDAILILETAKAVACVDVLNNFAELASRYGYVCPTIDEGDVIEVKSGRHPVVERTLPSGTFVPNDVSLSNRDSSLVVLTGPNMAGKSTYIRQVALIVLLAQIGSFVPAESAHIGIVDRIFTRVGLQDDLTTGYSTFMIEMLETAAILNQATPNSLVILDEIGRGTSTYDGLAIAKAVAEHLHNSRRLGCKTLFATHYHELTQLADYLPRERNLNVAVAENRERVVFLHRIVPGGANRSYGIHVAQLAGIPRSVINRAREILNELEGEESGTHERLGSNQASHKATSGQGKVPLIPSVTDALRDELAALDLDSISPLDALKTIYRWKASIDPGRVPEDI